jgi:hypothetical protein
MCRDQPPAMDFLKISITLKKIMLFKSESYVLETSLKKSEVLKRINTLLEPVKVNYGDDDPLRGYEGLVEKDNFSIKPLIKGGKGRAMKISIKGSIHENQTGTEISIHIRFETFLIIFQIGWCFFLLAALIKVLPHALENDDSTLGTLAISGMLIFIFMLSGSAFSSQTRIFKKDLKDVLERNIRAKK